jgi:hypothetical protein
MLSVLTPIYLFKAGIKLFPELRATEPANPAANLSDTFFQLFLLKLKVCFLGVD